MMRVRFQEKVAMAPNHIIARPSKARLASLCVALAAGCGGTQTAPVNATTTASQIAPAPVAVQEAARPPAPTTPDAPFRASEPAPERTAAFVAPHVDSFTLSNGMKVLLVERHELPVVTVQVVTRRGGDDAPIGRPGLASLVGTLLEMGTTTRNAFDVSDAYAALGAEHGTWMHWDSGGAFAKVLAPNLQPALDIVADIIEHPSFAPEEIERARARRLSSLRQELDSPRTIASNVAARAVYGEAHPYGQSLTGTEAGIRAITRDEIVQFYQRHFVPADSSIVVVGDVTRASVTPLLQAAFGSWRARGPAVRPLAAPAAIRNAPRILLVDKPGAPQSAVSVAQRGVPRSSQDYVSIMVMNTILGGMFSSRINLNLREAHAYTYGAGSAFAFRHGPGPFNVGGAIAVASTAPAVREIFNELARMRTTDVTEAELNAAKARLTESLPARFETTDQTAAAIAELFTYALPTDEYATITARINAITIADVRRAAQTYLEPDSARIIIVGDRGAVEPGLRELNMGEIEVVDAYGARPDAAANAPAARPAPGASGTTAHPAAPAAPNHH